ncbi:MAG TPA: hypothetical protein VMI53_09590, partial [Opitutaceae bacterium]|nr:hypothetical protein [Opitutaceae bacterium]
MNTLTHVFSLVATQSGRIGCLILVWAVLRSVLRGRVPQQILFAGWIVLAVGLLIPVSLPVAWSPFNFVRPAQRQVLETYGIEAMPALPSGMAGSGQHVAAARPVAPLTNRPAGFRMPGMALTAIWLLGMTGLLGMRLWAWRHFRGRLRSQTARASA